MPFNKIKSSKRAKAAIAAVMTTTVVGFGSWFGIKEYTEPKQVPAVELAVKSLIKPWEGLQLNSHWDRFAKIWDICYGETEYPKGTPIKPGMSFTETQCDKILQERVYRDYYSPLVRRIKGFTDMPLSVQASMISGAYNFGVNGMVNSTAAKRHMQGKYRAGCEAQTMWNKAGGRVVRGLVRRREMGDAQRIGEAELCVSGLDD